MAGASESTADEILAAIDEWLFTDDHNFSCIGYSEGQLCCLEPEHPNRSVLRQIIRETLESQSR